VQGQGEAGQGAQSAAGAAPGQGIEPSATADRARVHEHPHPSDDGPEFAMTPGYRVWGASPGMATSPAAATVDRCPACGEGYDEEGQTGDGRWTRSCLYLHDWDASSGELTEASTPPDHREPDNAEDDVDS